MRARELFLSLGCMLAVAVLAASRARAEQTRDFMIAAGESGTDVFVDTVLPGAQITLEHRAPIYAFANQLNLRTNALLTPAFFESQADVELRILVLTLGGTYGYRNLMSEQTFDEGEELDRYARRIKFVNGEQTSDSFAFGEFRATVSLPINDYVVFNGINTFRFEGGNDRSFDWRNAIVRDSSELLFKSDLMLFFKHRDVGGIAPIFQIMNFGLGEERYTQLNYGFLFATRPGFRRANDIFFVQFLFHPGSTFGSYDNSEAYGNHLLFSPISLTIAYRVIFEAWRPSNENED
jgi:hypothetical protein